MNTFIALLRGLNVGGTGRLPMHEFVVLLEALGCEGVRTYIQSGNAVFQHRAAAAGLVPKIRAALGVALGAAKGLEPEVLLLSPPQLTRVAAANPFPKATEDPAKLHVLFLAAEPEQPDLELLEQLRANGERFELTPDAFYLHAPNGIGRSKLAARVERALGIPCTGRNWRTVQKLLELARAAG